MATMARQIRRARKDVNMSQDAFARALGVGRRAPQRWEAGQVQPQARHLARICAVTGKSPEFFFSEDDDEESDLTALRAQAETLFTVAGGLIRDLNRRIAEEHVREPA